VLLETKTFIFSPTIRMIRPAGTSSISAMRFTISCHFSRIGSGIVASGCGLGRAKPRFARVRLLSQSLHGVGLREKNHLFWATGLSPLTPYISGRRRRPWLSSMPPRFLMMLKMADPSLCSYRTNPAIALQPSTHRPTATCRFPSALRPDRNLTVSEQIWFIACSVVSSE
jgi:hypothetical protein